MPKADAAHNMGAADSRFQAERGASPPAAPSPYRRSLLAGLGAARVAGGVAAVPVPAGAEPASADAALLALHHKMKQGEAAMAALADDYAPGCDERLEAALDPTNAAVDAMEALRATTIAGLQAKADALRWIMELTVCNSPNHDGRTDISTIGEDGDWQDRFAWSLARDVLALTPGVAGRAA